MEIRYFKATWGMEGSLCDQLAPIGGAGFTGFEAVLPADPSAFRRQVADSGLLYAALAFPQSVDEAKAALDSAVATDACLLNLHSGRDWWQFEEGCAYLEGVENLRESAPIPLCHETHRGRLFFSPGATSAYLAEFPGLCLAADFSHWTCVCESMLGDQAAAIAAAVEHTIHIHARVGHEEGPQVSDPRAPEFGRHVETFIGWWQAIVDSARRRGLPWVGIDPEFGPPGYMPTLPYTRQPVADLWEVCVWMRDRLAATLH